MQVEHSRNVGFKGVALIDYEGVLSLNPKLAGCRTMGLYSNVLVKVILPFSLMM